MASVLSGWHANAAPRITSSGVVLGSKGIALSTVRWFCVSVPVLSEHNTSTPANSSMADNRETMAFCLDNANAPSAMVTDMTAGMATGTEAISNTNTNCAISPASDHAQCPCTTMSLYNCVPTRISARMAARIIRKSPIRSTACSAWDLAPALATNLAVRPKNVLLPVDVTIPVIEPCRAIEPE